MKRLLGDNRGAIADYNKCIELDPKAEDAYNNRGNSNYYLNKYTEAIADYTAAIKLNPNYAEAYYSRGITKKQLNDKDGACFDLSKAGELGDMKAYDMIKKYCN